MLKRGGMEQYECLVCGWVYDDKIGDPDGGVPAGTLFEDVPDDWRCPMCESKKIVFTHLEQQSG